MLRIDAHTDRTGAEQFEPRNGEGPLQFLEDSCDDRLNLIFAFERIEQQQKLIVIDMRELVGAAKSLCNPPANFGEQGVAYVAAMTVIEISEVIESDAHDREMAPALIALNDCVDILRGKAQRREA